MNSTVLQLITSGLIQVEINDAEAKCYCRLVVDNLCPAYLNDTIWDNLFLVVEGIN